MIIKDLRKKISELEQKIIKDGNFEAANRSLLAENQRLSDFVERYKASTTTGRATIKEIEAQFAEEKGKLKEAVDFAKKEAENSKKKIKALEEEVKRTNRLLDNANETNRKQVGELFTSRDIASKKAGK